MHNIDYMTEYDILRRTVISVFQSYDDNGDHRLTAAQLQSILTGFANIDLDKPFTPPLREEVVAMQEEEERKRAAEEISVAAQVGGLSFLSFLFSLFSFLFSLFSFSFFLFLFLPAPSLYLI